MVDVRFDTLRSGVTGPGARRGGPGVTRRRDGNSGVAQWGPRRGVVGSQAWREGPGVAREAQAWREGLGVTGGPGVTGGVKVSELALISSAIVAAHASADGSNPRSGTTSRLLAQRPRERKSAIHDKFVIVHNPIET